MIQATIGDEELERRIEALPTDGITVFTLGGGRVRGALLHGTRMVNAMRANHGLGSLETLLLGRAYLCAALLGSTIKEGDRLVLRLEGDGPAEGLSVEASADGSVRGRLFRSPIPLEASAKELDPATLYGSGSLTVTRFSATRAQPFVGTVALRTGLLAQDLAAYYLESEQTRTAFDTGIEFDGRGRAIGAGALFLQALPNADEEFLAKVEESIPSLPRLGRSFAQGLTRHALIEESLQGLFPEILGEKPAFFACPCSRERFASFLESASDELLAELAREGPWPVETLCHNCGSVYAFTRGEIEAMCERRRGT